MLLLKFHWYNASYATISVKKLLLFVQNIQKQHKGNFVEMNTTTFENYRYHHYYIIITDCADKIRYAVCFNITLNYV